MKHWYLIPLAAILGLIAGSWGPRVDLAAMKDGNVGGTRRADSRKGHSHAGFGAIADLANVPQRASRSRVVRVEGDAGEVQIAEVATNAVAEASDGYEATNDVAEVTVKSVRVSPDDLRARIDEAAELWRTRVKLAKTQWKDKLELDKDGARQFDEAIEKMNDGLRATMVEASEQIAADGRLSTELSIKLLSAATAAMGEAYDDIGNVAADERRGEVAEMSLHDFIDPSVIEPLVSVQELLTDEPEDGER